MTLAYLSYFGKLLQDVILISNSRLMTTAYNSILDWFNRNSVYKDFRYNTSFNKQKNIKNW